MKNQIQSSFILILLALSLNINGQAIVWDNTIGGTNSDYLNCIIETNDSCILLAGGSQSNAGFDKAINSIGGSDYWIIKTDASGNLMWQKTYGGSDLDSPSEIQQTSDGGFICGGYSFSTISGNKTDSCKGICDYWILKLDKNGNIQWQKTFGGIDKDELNSITQTPDGGFICSGISFSGISVDKAEDSIGHGDIWIIKLDTIGNIEWQNTIGGNEKEYLPIIKVVPSGGYLCTCWSASSISGDKNENCIGLDDFWVFKLDSIGNIIWQNTIGGNSFDQPTSICLANDGGFFIAGTSSSKKGNDKTEDSHGWNYWLVKLDQNGNKEWDKTIGADFIDTWPIIIRTKDNQLIIGGKSQSNSSYNKLENSIGMNDYWIVITDSLGNLLWQNTIGGTETDVISSMVETYDSNIVLGGYSYSNSSYDKSENCIGMSDYWLMKVTLDFNLVTGKIFADANNNLVQDGVEKGIRNKYVYEPNSFVYAPTANTGFYQMFLNNFGNFSVVPPIVPYYTPIPSVYAISFSGFLSVDSLNDFAYQPTGAFDDVAGTLTPSWGFRSGYDAPYKIEFENFGTTIIAPTIVFYPDTNLSIIGVNPIPNVVTIDSLVWNFPSLNPFEFGQISMNVHIDSGLPVNTLIQSVIKVEPLSNDANLINNFDTSLVFTVQSCDPNEILVNIDTMPTSLTSNPPFLEYIIYFQNTGNDTALNVSIINPLDTFKLDLNTFEFISASHPLTLCYASNLNAFQFKFDNIYLPDSDVNELASHGFVRYRIKPKSGLIANDFVSNTAFIYFDFNLPVQTNIVETYIVQPVGIQEQGALRNEIQLYPNPTTGKLNIVCKTEINSIRIFDLTGRLFSNEIYADMKNAINLDVNNLPKGIFLLEVNSENNVFYKKFINLGNQ